MSEELISVTQAAIELGRQKQYLFKLIDRFGIDKIYEKSSDANGQRIAYISMSALAEIEQYISAADVSAEQSDDHSNNYPGVFYLIQLEPTHDPGRFKLGFASNIEERLRSHKTSAPYSVVVKTWPCKLLWEKTAIESATQDCEKIYTEVFRHSSIQEVEKRCAEFFALMPKLE